MLLKVKNFNQEPNWMGYFEKGLLAIIKGKQTINWIMYSNFLTNEQLLVERFYSQGRSKKKIMTEAMSMVKFSS